MEPNYPIGLIFTIQAINPSELKRGDLILYKFPDNENMYIHRLIGLPHETVEIHDGKVFIDQKPLQESYKINPISYIMQPKKLGENEYFVLGDNRNFSADSHIRKPVQGGDILGRAIPDDH
jgi:signal peptidase I